MQIGFIGLGKMGQNMVLHLLEQGIDVVGYNRTREVTENLKSQIADLKPSNIIGIFTSADYPTEVLMKLDRPHIIWLMVKAGQPVDAVIDQLIGAGLTRGDTIIDGGNSFYKDSIRRFNALGQRGIHFIDCGTSGGLEGSRNGACLMLGGEELSVQSLAWVWDALSLKGSAFENFQAGWMYMGAAGAGHFVKMVHNGVEYGMNQAIGEGFEMLAKGPYALHLEKVASTWNHGSIVRSYLVELLAIALAKDPRLGNFSGNVGGGETGKWAIETARELGVEVKVLRDAVEARVKSQNSPTFATKVVSALRKEYGGHGEADGK